MTYEALENAINEAEQFLKRAKKPKPLAAKQSWGMCLPYGKESSAVRRASMELTRALAQLRKY